MRRATAATVVVLTCALVATSARAYRTSEDSLYNQSSGITGRIAFEPQPVVYSIFRATTDVDLVALRTATETAFSTWTEPSCVDLTVSDGGATLTPAIYGDDRNVLEWVEDGSWSARGFSPFTIGVTTNQFLMVDGRWTIDESDMELNADGFNWVIDGGEPDADPVDVQGLVVHEAGHFLGLLHTCEETPLDGAPACGSSSEPETMWPRYTGENQRTLEADDIAGICYLYPAASCTETGCPSGETCVDDVCIAADAGMAMDGSITPDAATEAGTPDASLDAAVDGTPADGPDLPPASRSRGGCGCRTTPGERDVGGTVSLALLLFGLWLRGREAR
jgi:hypothetical protein